MQDGLSQTNHGRHPVFPLCQARQKGQVESTHHRQVSIVLENGPYPHAKASCVQTRRQPFGRSWM